MPEYVTPEMLQENWQRYVKAANKYNDPGKFTTLIAYEWTSIPNGRNMHRNVFFRNDTGPKAPFSRVRFLLPRGSLDLPGGAAQHRATRISRSRTTAMSPTAGCTRRTSFSADRWTPATRATGFERAANRDHPDQGQLGYPSAAVAERRVCDFELFQNMINVGMPSQIKYGYVRQGLVDGMILEDKLGTNPFKMGIVSGADSHSAIPTTKSSISTAPTERRTTPRRSACIRA